MKKSMIEVQPTPEQRRAFATYAVRQKPKWRTASPTSFAVPADLFVDLPEELLIGSLVDGRRYVSPDEDAALGEPAPGAPVTPQEPRLLACGLCYEEDGEEVHPHPECSVVTGVGPELVGVATEYGFLEAVPGDPLPEVSAEAYAADSVALPPPVPTEAAPSLASEGVFACAACDREFTTERGRDAHQRMKHAES
ncbi:hypothetical protein [Streptomyces sp. NPDC052179]|uniref:hypothetical protein n=1 Tax=Streptomyces sp. NPDC052179 TaxID=3155680 RepID=UPI003430C2BA